MHQVDMAIITTKKAASDNGRKSSALIPLWKRRFMAMKAAKTGHEDNETRSRLVASRIARISGAILHQYSGKERAEKRCSEVR
jgi:hypothetical protein